MWLADHWRWIVFALVFEWVFAVAMGTWLKGRP